MANIASCGRSVDTVCFLSGQNSSVKSRYGHMHDGPYCLHMINWVTASRLADSMSLFQVNSVHDDTAKTHKDVSVIRCA